MPDRKLAADADSLTQQLAQTSRALNDCEARYDAVFNSSMTFMCLCTAEGLILDVSTSSLELGGVKIEDCVGKYLWEAPLYAAMPEEAAKAKAAVQAGSRQVQHFESKAPGPNDEWRIFDVVVRPVGPLGADTRFIVLEARDLTATRAAEERARRAERMEALGLLTGGITHDFNNFLTVVIGALDMVARGPDRANRQSLIEAALEAAQKAESLNRQLLAFARRTPLAARDTDVGTALHALEPLLKKAVGEAVELHVHVALERQHVRMELAQFEAAILNLCVNARDAMPSGGRIRIDARPATAEERALADIAGPALTIAVRDTGAGIEPGVLSRVFDPFFTTKAAAGGTGLGLSQVYGFARQTGGGADVVSAPGQGSTFKIVLPTAPASERPAAPAVAAQPSALVGSVLLVEDDDSVAGVTSAMLSELAREVITLSNGPDAQRLLETRAFDLLVTDVIMPGGLNGVDLARWARARLPEMKVLLVSGWTADALVAAPGDLPIIQKPFDTEILRRAIQQL